MIIYIFGILFADVMLEYKATGPKGEALEPMDLYFGSLGKSCATLFRSISEGLTWHVAADALAPAGWFWVELFHFYIAFCSFALLNVMTGEAIGADRG